MVDILRSELNRGLSDSIRILSLKYGFEEEEGRILLGLKEKRTKIPLPFSGIIKEDKCCGVKLNYGLYTQCTNAHTEVVEIDGVNVNLCNICEKQTKKNGKPVYGIMQDRMKVEALEYRDPKGKQVVPYGNVMEKLNISREQAEKEARKENIIIAEEQFEVKKARRGRPPKNTSVSDTDSEVSTPKKRGRPKKEKQVISNITTGDDLIASLVAKAQETKTQETKTQETKTQETKTQETKTEQPKIESPPEDDSDEEVEVVRFKHKGIEYFKDADNILYNKEGETIGIWNETTKEIDEE